MKTKTKKIIFGGMTLAGLATLAGVGIAKVMGNEELAEEIKDAADEMAEEIEEEVE